MRVLHAITFGAEPLAIRDQHVVEAVDRVMIAEGVAERRRTDQLDAGRILVDEKQRMGAGVRAVGEPGLQDEIVGVVGAGDVPLLAGDAVTAGHAPRARLQSNPTSEPGPASVIA